MIFALQKSQTTTQLNEFLKSKHCQRNYDQIKENLVTRIINTTFDVMFHTFFTIIV